MELDWFTILAQMINFLLLMGLLYYFLYEPITNAMDERETHIKHRLNEAEEKARQAEEEKQEYRELKNELQERRDQKRTEAEEAAKERKQELLKEAKQEVKQRKKAWLEQFHKEQDRILEQVERRIETAVYSASRRVLSDLADVDVQKRVVHRFLERLREQADELHRELEQLEPETKRSVQVMTAFPLDEDEQSRISNTLQQELPLFEGVEFTTSPDLICGIRAEAGSWTIEWNVRQYLDHLEHTVRELFQQQTDDVQEQLGMTGDA